MSTRLVIRLLLLVILAALIFQRCYRSAAAQNSALKTGSIVKAELAGGATQRYALYLLAQQFVRVTVDHYGFDAQVIVNAPDGASVYEVEGTNDNAYGTSFAFITASVGAYQLTVVSQDKETAVKPYSVQVGEARAIQSTDEQRLAAERRIHAANKERGARTTEARRAALKGYGEALNTFRTINDRRGEAQALHEMARTYNDLGERELARDYHQQALTTRRANDDKLGAAQSLHNLGNVHGNLGDVPTALKHFDEALALRRELSDKRGELVTLNGLGSLWANRGDFKKATTYYEQVQQLARDTNDRRSEAEAVFGLGRFARQQGQPEKALTFYEQALSLYQAMGNRGGEASVLQGMGVAYLVSNDHAQAIDYLQRAVTLARESKNPAIEAQALNPLADAYEASGAMDQARATYDEALKLARDTRNQRTEAAIMNNLALFHLGLGERQRALELYQAALPLVQKFGGSRGAAPHLKGIAATYSALGEKQQALDYFQQALDTGRTLNDPVAEASILSDIATTLNSLGDRQRALDRLQEALAIAQRLKQPTLEADLLIDKGWLLISANEKEEALKQFESVQGRANLAPGKQISALNGAAICHNDLERPERALGLLTRALELARKIGSRGGEASSLLNLGWVTYRQENRDAAREHFTGALNVKRAISDRSGEAATLFALARLDRDAGELTNALKQIESALEILEALRAKVTSQDLRTSYFATVRRYYDLYIDVLMELSRLQKDDRYSAQALQASERARARSLLDMLSESRADIRQGVNPELVSRERELQDLLNGKADALLQARQRKGGEAQAVAIAKDLDALTGELQQLQTRIRQQSPRYATLTQPQPLNLKELQTRVLDENTILLEYALGEDRSYLWAVTPTSLRSYVLPKRAEIETAAQEVYRLLTVRNQSQRQLTAASGKIETRRMSPAQADAQYWRAARKLSQMILQPVAAQLGRKRLVIVAEGALQYVPFGALPVVGSRLSVVGKQPKSRQSAIRNLPSAIPLVLNHEIVNLPSASTLAVMREEMKDRQTAPRMIAVFADPVFDQSDVRLKSANKDETAKQTAQVAQANDKDKAAQKTEVAADVTRQLIAAKLGDVENGFRIPRLPFTRNEAERIVKTSSANFVDGQARISMDFAARRTALFDNELSQYRIVHIATHGLLDAERPELSALIFSLVDEQGKPQDGFLRAHEIYNLNLPAELVVLSACETGLGKQIRGEGLVGLTRGFMYAGAPRVVVSLWSVSDRATSELMAKFYRKLLTEKARPAEALRAAQIAMWNEGRWRAPYYWAAFTLQGEWR